MVSLFFRIIHHKVAQVILYTLFLNDCKHRNSTDSLLCAIYQLPSYLQRTPRGCPTFLTISTAPFYHPSDFIVVSGLWIFARYMVHTNESLAKDWLQHFIKHTNAGPNQPWKLLLLNGQKSHKNAKFVLICLANNIELLKYALHITHILQPLDVGGF